MSDPDAWPFGDPPNLATISTRPVMDGVSWIALVSHDEVDESWQFIGPEGPLQDQAMAVGLGCVFELDRSIAALADLPLGWQAWRDGPEEPWQRAPRED